MFGRSRESPKRKRKRKRKAKAGSDRPFEPSVWRHVSEIAERYRIVLEANEELEVYRAPWNCRACTATVPRPNRCAAEIREALRDEVATMLEGSEQPRPPPRSARSAATCG